METYPKKLKQVKEEKEIEETKDSLKRVKKDLEAMELIFGSKKLVRKLRKKISELEDYIMVQIHRPLPGGKKCI